MVRLKLLDLVLLPRVPAFLTQLRALDAYRGVIFANTISNGERHQYAQGRKHVAGDTGLPGVIVHYYPNVAVL